MIFIGIVVAILSENRAKTEIELRDLTEELKRSNDELQQFAYVASHDLKEPLRAVISFSQLLNENYHDKLDQDGKEFIDFLTDGAKRMNRLIDDLLSYSRITTHAKPPKIISLNDIMNDVILNISESIKENEAVITYDDLPSLNVDYSQILQLFQNLIANAIKFRRDEPPQIHIGVKKIEDAWLFSVKDNGIGIETQYFKRIFNIFQRLHTREEYPGSGIGLAICKKIVQRYEGKLWVESEYGKGSTFYFTIPFQKIK